MEPPEKPSLHLVDENMPVGFVWVGPCDRCGSLIEMATDFRTQQHTDRRLNLSFDEVREAFVVAFAGAANRMDAEAFESLVKTLRDDPRSGAAMKAIGPGLLPMAGPLSEPLDPACLGALRLLDDSLPTP